MPADRGRASCRRTRRSFVPSCVPPIVSSTCAWEHWRAGQATEWERCLRPTRRVDARTASALAMAKWFGGRAGGPRSLCSGPDAVAPGECCRPNPTPTSPSSGDVAPLSCASPWPGIRLPAGTTRCRTFGSARRTATWVRWTTAAVAIAEPPLRPRRLPLRRPTPPRRAPAPPAAAPAAPAPPVLAIMDGSPATPDRLPPPLRRRNPTHPGRHGHDEAHEGGQGIAAMTTSTTPR